MPRVNVFGEYLVDGYHYELISDEDAEDFWDDDGRYELYVIEIPASRLRYHNKAENMYYKAQRYLEKCVDEAKKHPGKVMRFD